MTRRLIQIKPEDWEKALSYDAETFTSGIFKVFSNCNPFFQKGSFSPVATPLQIGSGVVNVAKTVRVILPVFVSGVPQFYIWADDGKVYLNSGSGTGSDLSAQIISGSATVREAAIFQAQIIYATNTGVRSNVIPLSSGSDVQILNGLTSNPHPFVIGADRSGYMGNGNNVAKITNMAGTSGNSTSVAVSLETGYVVRKLINDGRYLVWLADNAGSNATAGIKQKNSCIVAFWDLAKSVFDQIYEFQDSYIASGEIIGDIIKVITPSGIYICNSATRPKLVLPLGSTILTSEIPSDHHSLTTYLQNFLMWGSQLGSGNSKILTYGNNIFGKPDRLFQQFTASGNPITALGTDNNSFLIAVGNPNSVALYSLNFGSNETSIANIAGMTLDQPYSFNHARIVLRSPISSGNSVSLRILSSNGTKTIKASETKTNSTDSGEKNLVFDATAAGDGSDVVAFDEISDIEITTNVSIKEFELYGDPIDERSTHG